MPYREDAYVVTLQQFLSLMNDLDITDPKECDQLSGLMATHLFTVHCANKDIEPYEIDKQRIEAYSFANMMHRKILDYLDYVERKKEC